MPIALGVVAAAGCSKFLTDGGRGHFTCSRFWLADLARREKWSFRKQQKNSRKLAPNLRDLLAELVLRTVFLVSTYSLPPTLMVNAHQTGTMHLRVKNGGWYTEQGKGSPLELQGHGLHYQFTCCGH